MQHPQRVQCISALHRRRRVQRAPKRFEAGVEGVSADTGDSRQAQRAERLNIKRKRRGGRKHNVRGWVQKALDSVAITEAAPQAAPSAPKLCCRRYGALCLTRTAAPACNLHCTSNTGNNPRQPPAHPYDVAGGTVLHFRRVPQQQAAELRGGGVRGGRLRPVDDQLGQPRERLEGVVEYRNLYRIGKVCIGERSGSLRQRLHKCYIIKSGLSNWLLHDRVWPRFDQV